ncbi:hypothetical protein SH580_12630 [Coraliomargarita algicola]|uniref:Peptidase C39-like domain-containing protein n=1 Tax=Coraliomargarita algicola TaxID=3092156 RepID=A0ABZ0RGD8_9BACT|nr:hypothetical protein [Coraliomargarita sp. J2-16]WPJ94281.1 hypothetical protein SH580_12630 [Coraliomargarita sp. J2-16]
MILPEDTSKCPSCKRSQNHAAELTALFLCTLVIALTFWFQLSTPQKKTTDSHTPERHPPERLSSSTFPASAAPREVAAKTPLPRPITSALKQRPEPVNQYITTDRTPRITSKPSAPKLSATRYQNTRFLQAQGDYPFYVAEKKWDNRKQSYNFYRVGMQGSERVIRHDVRRYFISENQSDYPEPEGGCGPTALLNLYIWYSKFGLIHESVKHSDPYTYKQLKFKQIDQIINRIQGNSRSRADGTNLVEQVVAIDELGRKASNDKTRIHFEYKQPPLNRHDFLNLTRNYRAGILTVRPKDPMTGRLMNYHAVLVIRGDTSGKITIANWGKFSHGRIVNRQGKQWFVPDDATQYEMQVERLTTLIPFTPTT